jgi:hypothetical protein
MLPLLAAALAPVMLPPTIRSMRRALLGRLWPMPMLLMSALPPTAMRPCTPVFCDW